MSRRIMRGRAAGHRRGFNEDRITRGTLQYHILWAFRKAGINGEPASGALVHGLRHTFATELPQRRR
jgi:integrase